MQRTCEGCGRPWQVETPQAALSLLWCPYTDCRCSFILQTHAGSLFVERARSFYRQRVRALSKQFDAEATEARAEYFLGAMLVTMLLSLFGINHWVGAGWAFFLGILSAPLIMVFGSERPLRALPSLGWLYLLPSLIVVSALTPSPLALFYALPRIALHGLSAGLIIALSSFVGALVYMGLRLLHAGQHARQALREEKRKTPRIEATQLPAGLPYR